MLLLASSSPRRSELLKMAGYDFTVAPTDVNEGYLRGTPPMQIVEQLASRKAQAAARANPQDTVLGADTLVVLKGRVFGKPKDADDAKAMKTGEKSKIDLNKDFVEQFVVLSTQAEDDIAF